MLKEECGHWVDAVTTQFGMEAGGIDTRSQEKTHHWHFVQKSMNGYLGKHEEIKLL